MSRTANAASIMPHTAYAQAFIAAHQNPRNCSAVRVWTTCGMHPRSRDIGADFHATATAFSGALENGVVYTLAPLTYWTSTQPSVSVRDRSVDTARLRAWDDDALLPFTHCDALQRARRRALTAASAADVARNYVAFEPRYTIEKCCLQRRLLVPSVLREVYERAPAVVALAPRLARAAVGVVRADAATLDALRREGWKLLRVPPVTWWRAQQMAYMVRLQAPRAAAYRRAQRALLLAAATRALPCGVMSAHVQHGPLKGARMRLYEWHHYAAAALQMHADAHLRDIIYARCARVPARPAVFLSTEDSGVVADALRDTRIDVLHVPVTRRNRPAHEGGNETFAADAHASLFNLFLALQCDAFIGQWGSNWNRLIDELRWTSALKWRAPFFEVGDVSYRLDPEKWSV